MKLSIIEEALKMYEARGDHDDQTQADIAKCWIELEEMKKPKGVDERIEQLDQWNEDDLQYMYKYMDDVQDMGDCDYTGYCTYQCRYYGSGCETI